MKHVRKIMLVLIACMMIGVGASLAYLHFSSDTATNTFSSNKKLSLLLREPAWDGYEFQDSYQENMTPGQVANPNVQEQDALGIHKASNYYPGDQIPKNPSVKNTSVGNESEYIAIKVEYIVTKNNVEKNITSTEFLSKYATTKAETDMNNDGIHDAYSNISTSEQYGLYILGNTSAPTILQANQTSPELFRSVNIKNDVQLDENGNLPNFQIKITAYAVQSANIDAETAVRELSQLAI